MFVDEACRTGMFPGASHVSQRNDVQHREIYIKFTSNLPGSVLFISSLGFHCIRRVEFAIAPHQNLPSINAVPRRAGSRSGGRVTSLPTRIARLIVAPVIGHLNRWLAISFCPKPLSNDWCARDRSGCLVCGQRYLHAGTTAFQAFHPRFRRLNN